MSGPAWKTTSASPWPPAARPAVPSPPPTCGPPGPDDTPAVAAQPPAALPAPFGGAQQARQGCGGSLAASGSLLHDGGCDACLAEPVEQCVARGYRSGVAGLPVGPGFCQPRGSGGSPVWMTIGGWL